MMAPMTPIFRPVAWRSPPLALQIMGLLLGGLVVAQVVTLALTLLLPPAPPAKYDLPDIAAALRQPHGAGGLDRQVEAQAPPINGRGWLLSDASRRRLAALLGAAPDRVTLAFYTPLPFAGTAGPPPRASGGPEPLPPARPTALFGPGTALAGWRPAVLVVPTDGGATDAGWLRLAQAGGPPGGGGGMGAPPMGMPGRAIPDRSLDSAGDRRDRFPDRSTGDRQPSRRPDMSSEAGGMADGPDRAGSAVRGRDFWPPRATVGPNGPTLLRPAPVPIAPIPERVTPPPASSDMVVPPVATDVPPSTAAEDVPVPADRPATHETPARHDEDAAPASTPPVAGRPAPAGAEEAIPPITATTADAPTGGLQGAIDRARRLFGLAPAPAPYVEGDFIAALHRADGRWVVVTPHAGGFLSPWQRRVALWFALAWGLTAPVGWLFARRLSRPLNRFAEAAAQLGRDPSVALTALDGPAEIGRAANAFNLMQQRLRAFVDDRTAMVGAISHDLRTPLTRMRFRVEEVPDDVRTGLLAEVEEMEAMIASVLAFMRDASTPGVRERLDLRQLVDDVVEDAAVVGATVPVDAPAAAPVEVDVLGMRRVLVNLLENALKYGAHARIRLDVNGGEAVAAVIDDGPGLPDDELEQVFQPFYRTAAARTSGAPGTGLGLAVCRSIARAHGGDVRLSRSPEGFRAEVRMPLAFDAARLAA